MARDDIHVGLEIGTTKVCALVAECREDGEVRLLGVGETPSRGVRKGEIVDFENASNCVREALSDAEEKSDVEIKSVWLAVTGSHIHSFNNRGSAAIPEESGEITEEEIQEVEYKAKEISLPKENAILHSIIQHYYVDGQEGVLNPVGMLGSRLEADFHIIHGVTNRIQNSIRCVKECHIEVEDVVVSSLASAQVVLGQHQKESGALVIDIGGGVTDYIVYRDGAVWQSGVLAVGGDHITNDISIGLRIPITRAEKLKVEEGSAILGKSLPGEKIVLKNDTGFSGKEVEREMLNMIIHARLEELFSLLRKGFNGEVPERLLGSGVMLTGGCSMIRGIRDVAESVFDMPVHLTRAQAVSGPTSAFENPQFSTCIGLAKYAQAVRSEMPEESFFGGWLKKVVRKFHSN
ncbi:MAG: cell division protein FtsA [Verrucomicrobiota bacterium]